MKSVNGKRDGAVSEVIGTVLVFAIFISIFTTVSSYYIPATQTASETNYQQASMSALSDLASSIASPSLSMGSIISQNIPMGIQGGILAPARPTSLTYSTTGIGGSINYGIGLSFAYTSNHPTSAILNKLLQTFPTETLSTPSDLAYDPFNSHIYVSGYASNVIATIDITHDVVLSYIYGGYGPKFMDLNLGSGTLYVADQKALNSTKYSYFTINEYSASSMKLLNSVDVSFSLGTSFNITAFTVDPANGNVYIAFHTLTGNSVTGSCIQEYSGGSLTLLRNVALSTSCTITDLNAYSSGNALLATYISPQNQKVVNPSFLVFNPTTLAYNKDKVNFSTFYSISGSPFTEAGDPYVTLTSVYSQPSSNLILFTFNITNQTGLPSGIGLGPGVAEIAGYSSNNNIIAATQFYSTAGYILDPQHIAYDQYSRTFAATVCGFKSGGSQTAQLYNFTVNSPSGKVESSNSYTGVVGDLIFAQAGNGQSYYLTTSSLSNTITIFSVSSGSISSYETILTNYFNGPYSSVYDSFNNYLYVTDYLSGFVSVIEPDTCGLISEINLGKNTFPTNLTFDPSNGTVYVLESQSSTVAVISGTSLYSTIPVINGKPVAIAFDPHDNAAYASIQTPLKTTQFINISKSGVEYSSTTYPGKAGSVAFDPYNGSNDTYGLVASTSGYYLYDISATSYTDQLLTGPSTSYPLTITFNEYSGAMYATSDQSSGRVYIYTDSSGTFSPYKTNYILAGSKSFASTFDPANNLLYIDNSGSSNITIYDTVDYTYFSTIWIGSTPLISAFDQENGYIFIPDYGFNKLSVIDGGFTIYNGKVGILDRGSFNFGGSISTYGATRFVTPESYVLEDGALFQNTSSGASRLLSPIPFAVLNQSGSLYFSDVSSSLTLGNGQTNQSASSYSSTNLKLQVLSEQNYTFSKGSQFYITDVYGNRYAAVATSVFMEFFNLTISTPYASLINSYLYSHYSGSTGPAMETWSFNGLPLTFNQDGNTVSISLLHPISLAFVSIVVYNIGLLEV